MTSERYEQVGWLHDEGRMFVSGIRALPEGQPQPEGWRPVFVRVEDPEPERCPTCGWHERHNRTKYRGLDPRYPQDGVVALLCPDPWHGGTDDQ